MAQFWFYQINSISLYMFFLTLFVETIYVVFEEISTEAPRASIFSIVLKQWNNELKENEAG